MTKSNQKFYRIYGIWAKHKFIIIPFVWPSHFRFSSASCLRGRLGGRGRNKSGKKRQIICIVEQGGGRVLKVSSKLKAVPVLMKCRQKLNVPARATLQIVSGRRPEASHIQPIPASWLTISRLHLPVPRYRIVLNVFLSLSLPG